MPFDVAPKKLSFAEQLAALIEAGRASNPDAEHLRGSWTNPLKRSGCALTFAAMALGIEPTKASKMEIAKALGVPDEEILAFSDVADRIMSMNDSSEASLQEIADAARAGTLPAPQRIVFTTTPFYYVNVKDNGPTFTVTMA